MGIMGIISIIGIMGIWGTWGIKGIGSSRSHSPSNNLTLANNGFHEGVTIPIPQSQLGGR